MTPSNMRKTFNVGDVVFNEGEPGDCAYIIEYGEVHLFITFAGQPKLINRLTSGHILGEMALIDNQLRSATAVAKQETCLMIIPHRHFIEKLESSDKFISLLVNLLLDRYREMRTRLSNITNNLEFNENYLLYTPDNQNSHIGDDIAFTTQQLEAENNLRYAIEQQQFELFYQPIISNQEGKVAGCETLIRWRHPKRGLISPIDFIGLAEDSGLIIPLGRWIIEQACTDYAHLTQVLTAELDFISINLSGKQLVPVDLLDNIKEIFTNNNIDPQNIKFEITESILMANPYHTASVLSDIKKLGSNIAIDDFGTGYSSFNYLHRFPIDTLKIDKSFISTMLENPKSYQIVKTLCILAKAIGMTIVAEGIESENEHICLKEMGVDFGQGYLYAKPLPLPEFQAFIFNRGNLVTS